ncbi:MAG: hypothetical protein CVV30_12285 [Methanomicrobiales archaeon HGW-Methanomicrobiales-1]|jgi:hypothetical protein|nr:MAG: hypothetical protein CVV30_12285 [Methanomicrobiales archaeon HGW-Methanomicrobiales-1]
MESLESKLDRLSPEQRREVEDFVDFLLYRSGTLQGVSGPAVVNPSAAKLVPPVIPVMTPILQDTPLVVASEQNIRQADSSSTGMPEESSPLIQEITVEVEDRISRDYMDYGQFEQQSSPATEAVKKVKTRLIQKSDQDHSSHLLDWVD